MFKDRQNAGRLLAKKLSSYKNKKNILVLAIPRGGVIVAYEIARELKLPLDILVIKKIGFPGNEELAIGAAGLDNYYLNQELIAGYGLSGNYLQRQIEKRQQEVKQRYEFLRGKKPFYDVKNKIVILVDDGVAMGATMLVAIQILRKQQPKKIIVAIPMASREALSKLKLVAEEVVCLLQPADLLAIGQHYQDFRQVEDEEVKKLLEGNKI